MKSRILNLSLVAAVWLLGSIGCGTEIPVKTPKQPARDTLVPKKGPFAKAEVDPLYDFGSMEVGEQGKYAFIIKNGSLERELVIKNTGDKSCSCTTSLLKSVTIPPGKSAKVELNWKIKKGAPVFENYVGIQTSDPKKEFIKLVVKGKVAEAVELLPEGSWDLGLIQEGKKVHYTGHLVTGLSDSIPKPVIDVLSKFIKVECKKMTPEELETVGSQKFGYNVLVTVLPDGSVGRFDEQIVIHTEDAKHRKVDFEINLIGTRSGPIEINPGGDDTGWVSKWDRKKMMLKFPEFEAKDGFKQSLVLFVSGLKKGEKLEIEDGGIETKPKSLFEKGRPSVQLEEIKEDAKTSAEEGARPKYLLTFSIKPRNSRMDYLNKKRALIRLKTNHDEAKVIEIYLDFLAN
ncbi:MAG: DUF1573 domain-containing protein [Planctomycetes bacterium]|nr:DUF1573 domain-containing protein [Planctomycetota bacterium]